MRAVGTNNKELSVNQHTASVTPNQGSLNYQSRSYEATRYVRLDGAILATYCNIVTITGPTPAVTGQMQCLVDGKPVSEADAANLTADALSDGQWVRL